MLKLQLAIFFTQFIENLCQAKYALDSGALLSVVKRMRATYKVIAVSQECT